MVVDLSAAISLTIGFLLTLILLLLVVWLALVINRGPEHLMKRQRYEAGNPPKGLARAAIPPQYYGYMLVFLVVDTVTATIFLLGLVTRIALEWIVVVTALLLPPLLYALKYSRRLEEWA